jgi:uncharacterized protein YjbJ (UPF0337 family)
MNKNQAKGVAKSSVGKIQQTGGKILGSRKQQAKGILKEAEGKAQKQVGDLQQAARDARKANKKRGR